MTNQSMPSKAAIIFLWIAQILLSLFMLSGAIMKFMPIEKIAAMMPWTGEVSPVMVRLLGTIDLLGGIGLLLPSLLRMKPKLTVWAAIGTAVLMICAIIFHLSRGEASVIGFNILCLVLAVFVALGRAKMLTQKKDKSIKKPD